MAQNDDETPSWLSESPAPAPAPAPVPAKAEAQQAPAKDPATIAAEEEEALRGVVFFMRAANLGISIAIVVQASFQVFRFFQSPQYWVLGLYTLCGGCLICLLETQISFVRTPIALNFGFLFNPFSRFIFYIFLATVCFSSRTLFGMICAGFLVAVAFYNTYVLIRYPAYRKLRDKLAKEEDEKINAALKEKVRKEATAAMFSK